MTSGQFQRWCRTNNEQTAQILQRLGRNQGRYAGESIKVELILRDLCHAAARQGWQIDKLAAAPGVELLTLQRLSPQPRAKRVYLSSGIHGDEPAGPLAVARMIQEDLWPPHLNLWICPCLNPTGFPLNTRECAAGADLNRDYRFLRTAEIRTHVAWLERQPQFDLTLCLHEDWEAHGFYLYELNPEAQTSLAEKIIEAVAPVCPIDPSPLIDAREAHHGIIRPNLEPSSRPDWPEAFYLITHKTRLSYTLEAPSDFPLKVRTEALAAATQAALTAFTSAY